ncbi:uncharacterized protein DNG_02007 [Cephalotrichum gorgonifer]|uniref:C2H2-type domain-containing protein n=1 Tax=Cephalotrichum gorgonifer TaxID=2041049 RepID=A0AAE8SS66_9PEZI|nr:uncharacterized protein DNG_02007 [Cephalotrichum gorgonifer]
MPPPPANQSVLCSECRVPFKDYISYANHRTRKMKAGEGHIHCEDCGTEFTRPETLDRHRKQEHAHEQDLDCPACGAHFIRLGGLMAHIERGQCKIGPDDIEHGRWVRSKMGRGLAELTGQDPKEYFGRFLGNRCDTLQPQSAIGSNKRLLGYIDTFTEGAPSVMSYKGRASEVSNVRSEIQYAKPQHSHGSDLRFSDKTLFPTPAEASSSKGKGFNGKIVERVNVPVLSRHESDTGLDQGITKPPTSVRACSFKEHVGSPKGKAPEGANLSGVGHHASSSGLLLKITESSTPLDAGSSKDPAKGSKGKVPEGLDLPGVVQNASSVDLGLGMKNFSSPVEAGSSKPATGKPKGKPSDSSNLQCGVAHHGSGASPSFLGTALFPTLTEVSKKQAKGKGQADDDHPTSVGVEDKDEPPLKPPKSLGDSIWAPKKAPNMSTRPSQGGVALSSPNAGNSLSVKAGQDSRVRFPPTSSEAGKAGHVPVFESHDHKGSYFRAEQQTFAENAKVVVNQRHLQPAQCHPTPAREAPSERAEQPETTSTNPGASPQDYGGVVPPHLRGKLLSAKTQEYAQTLTAFENNQPALSIPPHIREKIPGTDFREHCQAEYASVDEQPAQVGDDPFRSQPGLGTGLAISWADALKRENDTTSVKHSDQGTIGTPIASSRNSSGVPPHLRGNIGVISKVVDEESSTNKDCNADLPPHLQRGPGHASTIASDTNVNPALSMSDGQSTTKRTGSGSESEFDHRLRDNSGVVQTVRSYAIVTKGSGHIPPHLRVKQDGTPASPTGRDANKGDTTQVETAIAQQKDLIIRQTEDQTDPPTQISRISDDMMEVGEAGSGLGPHDPDHPQFDARIYYEQYSRRYLCPIPNCGKLFKTLQGITGHLASDVHRRPEMRLQCPHCLRKFKTTTALTQHAESQGRRCDIRNTTEFRPFIDQLTSGIADVEGVFEDQTNRYVVTEEALYRYGDEEIRGRAIKALEEHQRREIGEKEGEYWVGKEIAW